MEDKKTITEIGIPILNALNAIGMEIPYIPAFQVGDIFYSKWLRHPETKKPRTITVLAVHHDHNELVVDWGYGKDTWDLTICETALENGEYWKA